MENTTAIAYGLVLMPASSNKKTGCIPQTYSSESTCSASCPFKGRGCYGEGIHTAHQWRRADNADDSRAVSTYEELREKALAACEKQRTLLLRHNVAGDICRPGTSSIDMDHVLRLAWAYRGLMAYTYTHAAPTAANHGLILVAKERGFCINQSCEQPAVAARCAASGIPAVLAWDVAGRGMPAPVDGVRFVQCPAQTRGKSCRDCALCARANRKTVVVFDLHGNAAKKARAAVEAENSLEPIPAPKKAHRKIIPIKPETHGANTRLGDIQ